MLLKYVTVLQEFLETFSFEDLPEECALWLSSVDWNSEFQNYSDALRKLEEIRLNDHLEGILRF